MQHDPLFQIIIKADKEDSRTSSTGLIAHARHAADEKNAPAPAPVEPPPFAHVYPMPEAEAAPAQLPPAASAQMDGRSLAPMLLGAPRDRQLARRWRDRYLVEYYATTTGAAAAVGAPAYTAHRATVATKA